MQTGWQGGTVVPILPRKMLSGDACWEYRIRVHDGSVAGVITCHCVHGITTQGALQPQDSGQLPHDCGCQPGAEQRPEPCRGPGRQGGSDEQQQAGQGTEHIERRGEHGPPYAHAGRELDLTGSEFVQIV